LSATPHGCLITIEGGDGAGKTTQARLLATALEQSGLKVRLTREPGGSPRGEAIRRLLLGGASTDWDAVSEALLMVAARHDHVATLIAPALAGGTWVICDRFADSTLAYQGYGRGLDLEQLLALNRFALGDFAPDLTLVLDLAVEIAEARAVARAKPKDRFEHLDRAFRERLRCGFCSIAEANPDRCVVIDAAGDPQRVQRAILVAVETRLGLNSRWSGAAGPRS
jgi:dTMP kinase